VSPVGRGGIPPVELIIGAGTDALGVGVAVMEPPMVGLVEGITEGAPPVLGAAEVPPIPPMLGMADGVPTPGEEVTAAALVAAGGLTPVVEEGVAGESVLVPHAESAAIPRVLRTNAA
jgi:hypothetical protein